MQIYLNQFRRNQKSNNNNKTLEFLKKRNSACVGDVSVACSYDCVSNADDFQNVVASSFFKRYIV